MASGLSVTATWWRMGTTSISRSRSTLATTNRSATATKASPTGPVACPARVTVHLRASALLPVFISSVEAGQLPPPTPAAIHRSSSRGCTPTAASSSSRHQHVAVRCGSGDEERGIYDGAGQTTAGNSRGPPGGAGVGITIGLRCVRRRRSEHGLWWRRCWGSPMPSVVGCDASLVGPKLQSGAGQILKLR